MKLRKYFLCAAVALTAFGASLGLTDIGRYFLAETKKVEPIESKKEETDRTLLTEKITYLPRTPEPEIIQPAEQTSSVDEQEENTEQEFYADGDYFIIGDLPKGFKDFENLSIVTVDYESATEENNFRYTPIPPEGFVETKKKFKFTRINIANKQISFETEAKGGISYRFVGEFVEEGVKYKIEDGEEFTVNSFLKGRLIKMRDGKKIAESEVNFGISDSC